MDYAVWAVAFAFLAMGAAALLNPALIGGLVDLRFDSVMSRNEARAVYGGFGVAMAAALLVAIRMPDLRAGVLLAVGLALAGMAAGRLFSALVERPGARALAYCVLEAACAGLLFAAI